MPFVFSLQFRFSLFSFSPRLAPPLQSSPMPVIPLQALTYVALPPCNRRETGFRSLIGKCLAPHGVAHCSVHQGPQIESERSQAWLCCDCLLACCLPRARWLCSAVVYEDTDLWDVRDPEDARQELEEFWADPAEVAAARVRDGLDPPAGHSAAAVPTPEIQALHSEKKSHVSGRVAEGFDAFWFPILVEFLRC